MPLAPPLRPRPEAINSRTGRAEGRRRRGLCGGRRRLSTWARRGAGAGAARPLGAPTGSAAQAFAGGRAGAADRTGGGPARAPRGLAKAPGPGAVVGTRLHGGRPVGPHAASGRRSRYRTVAGRQGADGAHGSAGFREEVLRVGTGASSRQSVSCWSVFPTALRSRCLTSADGIRAGRSTAQDPSRNRLVRGHGLGGSDAPLPKRPGAATDRPTVNARQRLGASDGSRSPQRGSSPTDGAGPGADAAPGCRNDRPRGPTGHRAALGQRGWRRPSPADATSSPRARPASRAPIRALSATAFAGPGRRRHR